MAKRRSPKANRINYDGKKVWFHRTFLNDDGIGSSAHILWKVTENERWGGDFKIASCDDSVTLEFQHDTPERRRRAIAKIDRLIDSLEKFRNVIDHMQDHVKEKKN